MDILPLWYQLTVVIIFGLIIGSFLNVVMYRFHTGRSLSGSSHCLSCGNKLRWFELFPLISYLVLRGRCRKCGSYIPARYFLIELTTALLVLVIYSTYGLSLFGGGVFLLCIVLLMITIYDLYHMIIPNELVVATTLLSVLLFGLELYPGFQYTTVLYHALAAVGAFALYGGMWFISHGRWIGFGDAKLAPALAFLLGPMGTFSFIVFSFWVGAAVGILLLLYPRMRYLVAYVGNILCQKIHTCPQGRVVNYSRYLTIKSEIPFAPFMVIAFLLVFIWKVQVLELMMVFI